MSVPYSRFITSERRRPSAIKGRSIFDETASDRSRVIFSSPIRRLQQKAQVFSLEANAAVRTRLTHTLEVSDNARWIASKVADRLEQAGLMSTEFKLPFVNIVETACFLHDIGNPPFGHFGESAIQKWFIKNGFKTCKKSLGNESYVASAGFKKLLCDFEEFDGNPQGFRIITLLQEPPGELRGTGLNLLKCQLFSFLKYLRAPGEVKGEGILKKAGFFNSEKFIVDDLFRTFSHNKRFPLTYLMEAADDISYCLSDIEDGIEKGIIDIPTLFDKLQLAYDHISNGSDLPFDLGDYFINRDSRSFFLFKTKLAQSLIQEAANVYIESHNDILSGTRDQLFSAGTSSDNILRSLKRVSSELLFRSREAEDKEIAGYNVIYGLLKKFKILLNLSKTKFEILNEAIIDTKLVKQHGLEVEWRFFNILPRKYVEAYKYQMDKLNLDVTEEEKEWFLRAHLIVDFIAGMTDSYALQLYKLFHGIETE